MRTKEEVKEFKAKLAAALGEDFIAPKEYRDVYQILENTCKSIQSHVNRSNIILEIIPTKYVFYGQECEIRIMVEKTTFKDILLQTTIFTDKRGSVATLHGKTYFSIEEFENSLLEYFSSPYMKQRLSIIFDYAMRHICD